MPSEHPSVVNKLCNYTLHKGDPIPSGQVWGPFNKDTLCKQMPGAVLFYAFGYPIRSTGNPGYYNDNAVTLYVIVDAVFDSFLVVTFDKPGSKVGEDQRNSFSMDVKGTGLKGMTDIVMMDDGAEQRKADAQGILGPLGMWNKTTGQGSFYWIWYYTLGDGMVLGPMPKTAYTLEINVTKTDGATAHTFIGGWDIDTSAVKFTKFETAELTGLKGGLRLEGSSAGEICSTITVGGICISSPCCSWCTGEMNYACFPDIEPSVQSLSLYLVLLLWIYHRITDSSI